MVCTCAGGGTPTSQGYQGTCWQVGCVASLRPLIDAPPPLQAERKNDALVEQLEGLEAAHQRAVDLQEAAKLDRDQLIKKVQQMEKLVYVTDGRITPHHHCTLTHLGVRMLEQLWTAAGNRQAT